MADDPFAQTVALFRYGLIAEFLQEAPHTRGLYARLRHKAAQSYVIPGSTRTRVALDTLRQWIQDYRRGGFEALLPKPRADRGRTRALPQSVAEVLLELKEANRALSIPQLIRLARQSGRVPVGVVIAPSTVHRLFSSAGLMVPLPDQPAPADRRKFAFEHAGQLWMSDVLHGPSVGVPERGRRKSYLIAFLDDATRLVPYCAFALSENTQAFLPIFKQALLRRGIPQRLYVDNGANYRSQQLALVCAKLGVALIHARPYQPQGKGKMERWFRTVRAQFLSRLSDSDTDSLDTLNRKLWTWVEGEYHLSPHRGLEEHTPLDRWAMSAQALRTPGRDLDLDALFLFEVKRRVQGDRTLSLNGVLFEADAALIGQNVTVRFDPSAPASHGVEIWSAQGFEGRALPLNAYANCFVQRERPGHTIRVADTVPRVPPPGSSRRAPALPVPPAPRAGLALRDLANASPAPAPTPTPTPTPEDRAHPAPFTALDH